MWRIFCGLLITIEFMVPIMLAAQTQQRSEVVGCLSLAPDGTPQFRVAESGRVYTINGDMKLLQRHLRHLVAITPSAQENDRSLTAENIRDVADTCTAVTPSVQAGAVPGKSGIVQTATPVTSTAVTNETTAGFQTEAGAIQETGNSARLPSTPRSGAIRPLLPGQAGQSHLQAETNAEAAGRAEMYPGITLGVDIKSAPASSTTSILESNQHLQPKSATTEHK